MGRPSKFSTEIATKIVDAIRQGSYYEPACRCAGVSYRSFRRWMKEGEAAKSGKFRQFWQDVTRAEAEAEIRIIEMWQEQMPRDWRACRDYLARRFPKRWSLNAQNRTDQGTAPAICVYVPENFRDPHLSEEDEDDVSNPREQFSDVA